MKPSNLLLGKAIPKSKGANLMQGVPLINKSERRGLITTFPLFRWEGFFYWNDLSWNLLIKC
jgi:hypothetical protein